MAFVLTGEAFGNDTEIPREFTGEGRDVSPALKWSGVPAGTREFALICEDPDAPGPDPFVHWMIYNISPNTTFLPEGLPARERLETPVQADQGQNSGERIGYMGPMPPIGSGIHHYIFKLFALDAELGIRPGIDDKQDLLDAMEGHILDATQLIGKYIRHERGAKAG